MNNMTFVQLGAGADDTGDGEHSCGITVTGTMYCWGLNNNGQLGNGTTTDALSPTIVPMTGALSGKKFVQVATGMDMTCGLTADNLLFCWGRNDSGQLGNGTTTSSATPVAVTMSGALSGKTIRSISTGFAYQVCATATDNTAYCWGRNTYGEIGNNTTTNANAPVAVQGLPANQGFLSVTASQYHTCGVTTSYQAYCWGSGAQGQLGNNATSNQSVATQVFVGGLLLGQPVIQTSGTNQASCGLAATGKMYCWGVDAGNGQLGDGSNTTTTSTPVAVSQGSMLATSIAGGRLNSCALATTGDVYCWGNNDSGSFSNGTTTSATSPTTANNYGLAVGQVTVGSTHTCILTTALFVGCAGSNSNGQIGDGTTTARTIFYGLNTFGTAHVTFDTTNVAITNNYGTLSVTASSPAHAASTVNTYVTRQDGATASYSNSYTYNATVPGTPTGLATTPANSSVILNWTAPTYTGGVSITDYKVEYSSDGGTTWNTFSHATSSATTQTVTGLAIGTTYTFRVSAVNSVGAGSPSSTATGTPIYITASASSSLAIGVTPADTARLSSNYQDVSVTTNAPGGYTLGLSTSGASQNLANGGFTIGPSSGTFSSPVASLVANTWGYRVDGTGGFGSGTTTAETNVNNSAYTWAGVRANGSPDTIQSRSTAVSGDSTRVWYAVSVDVSKPAGTYTNTIIYTAVSN